MKKIILLSILFCLACPLQAFGDSPMVERHIFSPEPDGKGSFKSPMALKLEKELIFTGVVISPQGKWAIISEKGQKKDAEVRGLRKEGDEIKGMVIKEIGNNFLILAGDGKEVRLNLYHEGKLRPARPAGSEPPSASAEKSRSGTSVASPIYRAPASNSKSSSPFAQAPSSPAQGTENKSSAFPPTEGPFQQESAPNPFLQEAPPGSFPQEFQNSNPSMQETPPNPFLQETPPNPFLQQTPPNP